MGSARCYSLATTRRIAPSADDNSIVAPSGLVRLRLESEENSKYPLECNEHGYLGRFLHTSHRPTGNSTRNCGSDISPSYLANRPAVLHCPSRAYYGTNPSKGGKRKHRGNGRYYPGIFLQSRKHAIIEPLISADKCAGQRITHLAKKAPHLAEQTPQAEIAQIIGAVDPVVSAEAIQIQSALFADRIAVGEAAQGR